MLRDFEAKFQQLCHYIGFGVIFVTAARARSGNPQRYLVLIPLFSPRDSAVCRFPGCKLTADLESNATIGTGH